MSDKRQIDYHNSGDGTTDTSNMLLTVSSFGETSAGLHPAEAFLITHLTQYREIYLAPNRAT